MPVTSTVVTYDSDCKFFNFLNFNTLDTLEPKKLVLLPSIKYLLIFSKGIYMPYTNCVDYYFKKLFSQLYISFYSISLMHLKVLSVDWLLKRHAISIEIHHMI